MVAAMVAAKVEKLLVLVPSHALRQQVAEKFERLGLLPSLGLVGERVQMPTVGRLLGTLADELDGQTLASSCNVVVSTVQALAQSNVEIRAAFLSHFSHLFIDEAHHVAAETWRTLRDGLRRDRWCSSPPHRIDATALTSAARSSTPSLFVRHSAKATSQRFAIKPWWISWTRIGPLRRSRFSTYEPTSRAVAIICSWLESTPSAAPRKAWSSTANSDPSLLQRWPTLG